MDIVKETEIKERLLDYYHKGGGTSYYVGYKSLAKHYSIVEGSCTDWTGYAGSGKTELLLDLLKNCSRFYRHKQLIHMPDAGTIEEVVGSIIHKMAGKQFDEFFYNDNGERVLIKDRVTEEEVNHYLPIVLEYFKILDPKTKTNSKALTPKEFWQFAVDNKTELGIFSAVIDSWNYMRHDTEGFAREDKWLEDTLSFRNELAERSKMHFHTVIHPTKARKDKDGRTIPPDMHSLKGGSEWSNNGKSIIIVDRDFESNSSSIIIAKAKPKIVGIRGVVSLKYDVKTGQYYEFVNGQRLEAAPLQKPVSNNLNAHVNNEFDNF